MRRQKGGHPSLLLAAILSLTCLTACDTGSQDTGAMRSDAVRQSSAAEPVEVADDAGSVAAPTEYAPEGSVVAELLPYAEVDDELVYGYFVFPVDMVDPLPGLIVFHEWWGLNDDVRAMADRIAAEGYIVLAVDLFGGRSTSSPGDARAMMIRVVENPQWANQNIRQAYQFLIDSGQAPRIGALGWGFGGGWSLNTALLFPDDLDAAVIFYGQVTSNEARLAPLHVPLLGLFGEDDRGIRLESVRGFEQALDNLGKNIEIEIYPQAEHAFANPAGINYNARVAEQAWTRVFEFLDRHLSVTVN